MIRVGLVGLPNAGKSTLFNFLTGANVLVASYPFSTVTPNKASLKVYDRKAEELARAVGAPNIMHGEVEVWDIAGLIENASEGEGLGNEFLAQIKDCNVIVHVVRIDHESTQNSVNSDMQTVLREMALFDHKCLLKPFEKARRMARLYPHDASHKKLSEVLTKAYYGTKKGDPITEVLADTDMRMMDEVGLVSIKPRLVVFNVSGGDSAIRLAKAMGGDVVGDLLEVSALLSMTDEERTFLGYSCDPVYDFLQNYSDQLIRKMRYKRFYTVGHLGVGQWFVSEDANAKICSQVVHKDLAQTIKGVSVAKLSNFIKYKSWASLTKQGLSHKYGPAHIPSDEDVLRFEL